MDLDRLSLSWAQEEPPSLRQEQEGGQGSPGFFIRPSHILFVRTEGLFAEPILVRAGAAGLGKVAGRAPSLCAEREGRREFPWLFICPSRVRVCLPRPLWAPARVVGSRRICRKSPLASAQGERAVRSSPVFLYDPHASFSLGRRVCFAEPL